jgi:hypothetical protein
MSHPQREAFHLRPTFALVTQIDWVSSLTDAQQKDGHYAWDFIGCFSKALN